MAYPLLRAGNRLPTVATTQLLLNRAGAEPPLVVDGIYGPNTKSAVLDFQRREGLGRDGVVGENTWGRLVSSVSAAAPEPIV